MNLVWHIVRKDYRRVAYPLKLWLLLVLWHALFPMLTDDPGAMVAVNYEGQRYVSNMFGALAVALGFILAAWLVMEDSLISTAAAWRTRPISGGRLLAAKALGALLMLSVLPVVVLTPVWWWCGFSLREWAYAALEWGLTQAVASLLAFALAGVTETNRQFLVRLLVGFIALPFFTAFVLGALPGQSGQPGNLAETRSLLLGVVMALIPVAMAVHQFLTRRTGRTWLILVAGLGLMWVGGRWWPWTITGWDHSTGADRAGQAAGPIFTADHVLEKPLNALGSRVPLQLDGRVTGLAPSTYVRVSTVRGDWVGGAKPMPGTRFAGEPNPPLPANAVRSAAGLAAPAADETTWSTAGVEQEDLLNEINAGHLKFQGAVRATVLRGAVLGELPLQVGATLRAGSSLTRVHSLHWVEDKLVVQLEERDAWVTADSQGYSTSYIPAQNRNRPAADGFVVLNRAQGFDQMPGVQEVGTVKAVSIVTGRRNLVITPPADHEAWLKGAVILKVRFTTAEKIDRPISGEPLTLTR